MDSKTVFNWPPLESDPEIFNKYFKKVGLPENITFNEIFTLDDEIIMTIPQPVYSVIVNFEKGKNKREIDDNSYINHSEVPFYMHQSGELDNACGLIAALHSFGNNLDNIKLDESSILSKFFKNAKGKNPKESCSLLENMKEFQQEHIKYASQGQSKLCDNQEQVRCHFIAFVYVNGKVVELDGTKNGPIVIKENIKDDEFISNVAAEIKDRLSKGQITESLSMMYLGKD